MKATPELNRQLRREVQNFNKKIKRLEQKGVSPSLLPTKASVRSLKLAYDNKRDLNRRLKQMRSFTAKGEVRENIRNIQGTDALFKYRQKELNKKSSALKRAYKKLSSQPIKYKSVRDDAILNVEAKMRYVEKDIEKIDLKTLQRLNKIPLTKESLATRQENYYDSYFKMLFQESEISGVSRSQRLRIEKELRKFTPAQLSEITETEPAVKSVLEQYEGIKQYKDSGIPEEDAIVLANKIQALNNALPAIKAKYGIK